MPLVIVQKYEEVLKSVKDKYHMGKHIVHSWYLLLNTGQGKEKQAVTHLMASLTDGGAELCYWLLASFHGCRFFMAHESNWVLCVKLGGLLLTNHSTPAPPDITLRYHPQITSHWLVTLITLVTTLC